MSDEEDPFLATVEAVGKLDPALSPLDGVILAALYLGLAEDTRGIAKLFEVEHALVIRAVHALAENGAWLDILERHPRTQRTKIALTATGSARLSSMREVSD